MCIRDSGSDSTIPRPLPRSHDPVSNPLLSADNPATSTGSAKPRAPAPATAPPVDTTGAHQGRRSQDKQQKARAQATPTKPSSSPGKPTDYQATATKLSTELGKAIREKAELEAELAWAKDQFDEEACRRAKAERHSLELSLIHI